MRAVQKNTELAFSIGKQSYSLFPDTSPLRIADDQRSPVGRRGNGLIVQFSSNEANERLRSDPIRSDTPTSLGQRAVRSTRAMHRTTRSEMQISNRAHRSFPDALTAAGEQPGIPLSICNPELCGGLAVSGVFRGRDQLNDGRRGPAKVGLGLHTTRESQDRRYGDEKACFVYFLSIPHRLLSSQLCSSSRIHGLVSSRCKWVVHSISVQPGQFLP